jgi:hypothetical protein
MIERKGLGYKEKARLRKLKRVFFYSRLKVRVMLLILGQVLIFFANFNFLLSNL